jgi:integrase
VNAFLTHLAVQGEVAASTQAQALSALLFLYRHVLGDPLPWLDDVVRARKPRKLPVVLTREEVRRIMAEMSGPARLVVSFLYGSGLRLLEALRLRVKEQAVAPDPGTRTRCSTLDTISNVPVQVNRGFAGRFMSTRQ